MFPFLVMCYLVCFSIFFIKNLRQKITEALQDNQKIHNLNRYTCLMQIHYCVHNHFSNKIYFTYIVLNSNGFKDLWLYIPLHGLSSDSTHVARHNLQPFQRPPTLYRITYQICNCSFGQFNGIIITLLTFFHPYTQKTGQWRCFPFNVKMHLELFLFPWGIRKILDSFEQWQNGDQDWDNL